MQQVGIFNLEQQQLTFLSEDINAKQENSLMALKNGVLIGRAVRERDIFTTSTIALSFSLYHKEDGHVVWTSPDVSGFIRSRDADMGDRVRSPGCCGRGPVSYRCWKAGQTVSPPFASTPPS